MNILITGGAGFIGSHVVERMVKNYPDYHIFNADCLTYAGNLENLVSIENERNYSFIKLDIRAANAVDSFFQSNKIHAVIHLAAESHVDRSITEPNIFIETNVMGTANLLNAFKNHGTAHEKGLFYHVSTDEVYGSLGSEGLFTETTSYDPKSPYSASKAASDHLVRAYGNTYDMPYLISNCSNNYGPRQFPEKLIPLCIHNILNDKPLPIYGDGSNIRDWLYVIDHAIAIDALFHNGKRQETYNIGGLNEKTNLELVKTLCRSMDKACNHDLGTAEKLITFVKDRAGHDQRYAIDCTKLTNELKWQPTVTFEEGLLKTVEWYLSNAKWLDSVTSGAYLKYYDAHYG